MIHCYHRHLYWFIWILRVTPSRNWSTTYLIKKCNEKLRLQISKWKYAAMKYSFTSEHLLHILKLNLAWNVKIQLRTEMVRKFLRLRCMPFNKESIYASAVRVMHYNMIIKYLTTTVQIVGMHNIHVCCCWNCKIITVIVPHLWHRFSRLPHICD